MKTQILSYILYHRWAGIEQNHQSYTSLQRKHENTLHSARSGASIVSYLFSENWSL
jgi:hypothetical protein